MKKSSKSGKSYFYFDIERLQNKTTGEYCLITDDADQAEDDNLEYKTVTLNVVGSYFYEPGNYSRLPEDCYPDESEVDVESAFDANGKDWWDDLTASEKSTILDRIPDNIDCDGYYDD